MSAKPAKPVPVVEDYAWVERSAFRSREAPDLYCPSVIDLTGRARNLVFGPYLNLRPGLWRATAFLHLCPDAAKCRLTVQFGDHPNYTGVETPFGVQGPIQVQIERMFLQPGRVELRILLTKAAFHGELRFEGAKFERIGEPAPASDPSGAAAADTAG